MEKIIKILENLGLTEKQVKIYLACLELGTGSVHEIADKSGIKRTNIYNLIEDLKAKNLISELIQDNKLLLVASDPQTLLINAKKHTQILEKNLPELMNIFNLPGHKPKVQFFQGKEGIRKTYQDMVGSGEDIWGFSDYEKMFASADAEFLWSIPKQRVENKLFYYCIAKLGPWGRKVKSTDKKQLRETRLIKDYDFDTEINIYGNKVAMISYVRPYASVIIEDKGINKTMRSVWKIIWKSLEKSKS